MVQSILKVSHTLLQSIEGLLAHTVVARGSWNLQVVEGILQISELLLQCSDSRLQVTEVLALELFELGAKAIVLVLELLSRLLNLLLSESLHFTGLFVSVCSQLETQRLQIVGSLGSEGILLITHLIELSSDEIDLLKDGSCVKVT